jgi:ParB family transcriptional regulator, chromosome partitioning protein
MASAVQKIKFSPSRDTPFYKPLLSQSNVRRVRAGVSIEQLAESIALCTLLPILSVRAVVDADATGPAILAKALERHPLCRASDRMAA